MSPHLPSTPNPPPRCMPVSHIMVSSGTLVYLLMRSRPLHRLLRAVRSTGLPMPRPMLPVRLSHLLQVLSPATSSPAGPGLSPAQRTRRPVSYTHLRAHETRHDLV